MTDKSILRNLKCLTIANDICKSRNKPYGISEILAEVEHIKKAIEPVIEQGAFEQVIGTRNNYPTNL